MPILTRLRFVREAAFMSQAELAERSGVAQPTISHLEQGRAARFGTARKLAKALGVTPTALSDDAALPAPAVSGIQRSSAPAEPPGLAPLLERAEHFRLMGNQPEAARWQRLADQLLAESGSVE
jgi:transcriptional regulator with XRE-family HTH domain